MSSADRYHTYSRHGSGRGEHGDTRAECQRLLSEFRVHELKELLRKVGQSQRGKKAELFQRANEILRHGSPKIQLQIREIHKHYRPYSSPSKRNTSAVKSLQLAQQMVESRQGYVVHPDVKFKAHPFYKLLETVIRPTALVSTSATPSGGYSMRLQFYLSPTQVQQIYKSKNTQGDYLNQIIIRFARQETSCEQDDFYPRQCYIRVNGDYVTIPGYIPQYSHRPDYKRNGKPINVTKYVNTSASHANDVIIYWNHDILYPMGFCVTIEQVENLSSSDLLSKLKSKGIRSPDISRALVKEKLSMDRDSEISATSLRISLICPLGKVRITNPCRSMSCSHLQCFDANIYLQMNERKAQWICPVCDKPAPFKDLFVDGFFKEICEQSSSDTIEFSADGAWRSISSKVTLHSVVTPDTRSKEGPITIGSSPKKSGVEPGSSAAEPIVIDLTLSDDEDEEPIGTTQSRKSSSSSESDASTTSSSTNASGTIDERDSVQTPSEYTAHSSHVSRDSITVSVITQGSTCQATPIITEVPSQSTIPHPAAPIPRGPTSLSSRAIHQAVIRQDSPPPDVITLQHGFQSGPSQQDMYHDNYNELPMDDDNIFSLLDLDFNNYYGDDSSF